MLAIKTTVRTVAGHNGQVVATNGVWANQYSHIRIL
jgi:hypothetical protein